MFYKNCVSIRLPVIEGQDYEINPQMITLFKQKRFCGLSSESPMDHIEAFEDLCTTTSTTDIPPDYLRCKLFPFSLSNKAHRWLKSLTPRLITSWDQYRASLLNHFYTRSKTMELRNMMTTFHQGES
ncbi:hypothetical protein V5N11_018713 [Cardamine amara subsp. amara]|uniref:Retrotransposon gag domain-containing protein n=1 Tax=Cardamine amara subsp. amara TaxID=228776 RepID=A0ABD1AZI7_CARAN